MGSSHFFLVSGMWEIFVEQGVTDSKASAFPGQ